jgi:hypothetical protein
MYWGLKCKKILKNQFKYNMAIKVKVTLVQALRLW